MNAPALHIQQLNQCYGDLIILNNINLTVNPGEAIGLVGMNGVGKTTLIKSILDFISISSGEIKLFGRSHRETSSRATLSFLPEKFLPPYYLTGENFLAYMAGLNQIELDETAILNIFDILDLDRSALKKSVRQYSKGMAQKLGLASCLLSQRPLLLFDEPMSGLDPKARAYLKRYLIDLKKTGVTLFFSTHLLTDVERLCDRIVILHHGQIRFNGAPVECCKAYGKVDLEEAYLHCIASS